MKTNKIKGYVSEAEAKEISEGYLHQLIIPTTAAELDDRGFFYNNCASNADRIVRWSQADHSEQISALSQAIRDFDPGDPWSVVYELEFLGLVYWGTAPKTRREGWLILNSATDKCPRDVEVSLSGLKRARKLYRRADRSTLCLALGRPDLTPVEPLEAIVLAMEQESVRATAWERERRRLRAEKAQQQVNAWRRGGEPEALIAMWLVDEYLRGDDDDLPWLSEMFAEHNLDFDFLDGMCSHWSDDRERLEEEISQLVNRNRNPRLHSYYEQFVKAHPELLNQASE